jgi:hypothetical protein
MAKTSTDGGLQETITKCLDCAMANRLIYTHGPFHRALKAQSKIGWVSMLQGYWSQEWQMTYKRLHQVPTDEDRKAKNKHILQMARWQKLIIQTVWDVMIKLWKIRNDERHGWDQESRDRSRREVLHHKLAEIYGRKHEYPQHVQNLPYYAHHFKYTHKKRSPN